MRDFELFVFSDCTASNSQRENKAALELMQKFLKADIRPSSRIRFRRTPKKKRVQRGVR